MAEPPSKASPASPASKSQGGAAVEAAMQERGKGGAAEDPSVLEKARMVEALSGVSWEEVKECPQAELEALLQKIMDTIGETVRTHAVSVRPRLKKTVAARDAQEGTRFGDEKKSETEDKPKEVASTGPKMSAADKFLGLGYPLFEGMKEVGLAEGTQEAMGMCGESWVCVTCRGNVVPMDRREKHAAFHKKNGWVEPKYEPMTWQWYLETAKEISTKPAITMYTMEGPLCYVVNTAMRNYKFKGDDSQYSKARNYAFSLRQELSSYPPVGGGKEFVQLFRAVGYEAHKAYPHGSIQRMPQPTSTTTDVAAMTSFFKDKTTGCVLLFNSKTARAIKDYSAFPEEDEILVLPETPFKVAVADPVVVAYINGSLKLDFEVGVVRLDEITEDEVLACGHKWPEELKPEETDQMKLAWVKANVALIDFLSGGTGEVTKDNFKGVLPEGMPIEGLLGHIGDGTVATVETILAFWNGYIKEEWNGRIIPGQFRGIAEMFVPKGKKLGVTFPPGGYYSGQDIGDTTSSDKYDGVMEL